MIHADAPEAAGLNVWQKFVRGPYAVTLTHGSALLMTVALFAGLWYMPFWLAFVPGVFLAHRIGIVVHEYIHRIPFRRYRYNLWVLSFFDSLFLMFGLLELFRGTHLAHHRWLNREGDPGYQTARAERPSNRLLGVLYVLEAVQHFEYFLQTFSGKHPYVRPRRIALGAALSVGWISIWVLVGRPDMIFKIIALTLYTTLVPISMRGAVEHHGLPGDEGFSNEYKVLIPMFNLNRHQHHHQEPRVPWYLLEFRTPKPLDTWHYFTHWFHVYLKRDYVLMRPMESAVADDPQRSTSASK